MFDGSMPRSCISCMLKSLGIVAAFPIMPSGWVDICDTGPIPVAGRLTGTTPEFNLLPELICMRRMTSSSFSWKTQNNKLANNQRPNLRFGWFNNSVTWTLNKRGDQLSAQSDAAQPHTVQTAYQPSLMQRRSLTQSRQPISPVSCSAEASHSPDNLSAQSDAAQPQLWWGTKFYTEYNMSFSALVMGDGVPCYNALEIVGLLLLFIISDAKCLQLNLSYTKRPLCNTSWCVI